MRGEGGGIDQVGHVEAEQEPQDQNLCQLCLKPTYPQYLVKRAPFSVQF